MTTKQPTPPPEDVEKPLPPPPPPKKRETTSEYLARLGTPDAIAGRPVPCGEHGGGKYNDACNAINGVSCPECDRVHHATTDMKPSVYRLRFDTIGALRGDHVRPLDNGDVARCLLGDERAFGVVLAQCVEAGEAGRVAVFGDMTAGDEYWMHRTGMGTRG